MNKRMKFRQLLQRDGIIVAPGAPDAITARIIQEAGFEVCYMGGNAAVASALGVPDVGLATFSDMVSRARSIDSCINIPLFCDADTGYGNVNNVMRTVREFEKAGVVGIHLEDQVTPKKCGAMNNLKLISVDESAQKIRAAIHARTDPDFVILARTDARTPLGLEEAIRRIQAFEKAGADMVYVEMLQSEDEVRQVVQSVSVPVLYDALESTSGYAPTAQELQDIGIKMVIYPMSAILYTAKILSQFMADLKMNGTTQPHHANMMALHDYEKLLGIDEQLAYQNRFDV
ncbi:2-methylisocitrate lyase [Pusillimonas sp. T7-7]|uniref:isocitrate lyase/PEP mutase family protein n=1 Tax=Pusillimonas sp. (strain T7-7) TaxID=1007105 RepID=UPI00020850BD|nr:isocitrate lyase/PEP mutase family protein [Pusillimonas sp. T7-7]AEC21841.1 2-methylisocitrate lyase [Pusillimonas sp. T7-7]